MMAVTFNPASAIAAVQAVLTPDLLKPEWRTKAAMSGKPFSGHCYAAAEAVYHLLGGLASSYVPQVLNHARWPLGLDPGETHWFLKCKVTGMIVDPTAAQFGDEHIDYAAGVGAGFLTKLPSKRAAAIIKRLLGGHK